MGIDQVQSAKLIVNGEDRFEERNGSYFRKVQRFQYHTGTSSLSYLVNQAILLSCNSNSNVFQGSFGSRSSHSTLDKQFFYVDRNDSFPSCIYLYSFCLEPEKYQPTGTLNFSRLENAMLQISLNKRAHKESSTTDTTTKETQQSTSGPYFGKVSEDTSAEPRCINVYAVTYNFLDISQGQGNLKYSN
mgnify:CR=1 FL=1